MLSVNFSNFMDKVGDFNCNAVMENTFPCVSACKISAYKNLYVPTTQVKSFI